MGGSVGSVRHLPGHLLSNGGLWGGRPAAHLWSGLGLPFLRMLLAVVSLKCRRPTVTFVTCSGGRLTLWRRAGHSGGGGGLGEPGHRGHPGAGGGLRHGRLPSAPRLPSQLRGRASQRPPSRSDTHVTGLKGRLLLSDCDCSMLMDWFRASSWGGAGPVGPQGRGPPTPTPSWPPSPLSPARLELRRKQRHHLPSPGFPIHSGASPTQPHPHRDPHPHPCPAFVCMLGQTHSTVTSQPPVCTHTPPA